MEVNKDTPGVLCWGFSSDTGGIPIQTVSIKKQITFFLLCIFLTWNGSRRYSQLRVCWSFTNRTNNYFLCCSKLEKQELNPPHTPQCGWTWTGKWRFILQTTKWNEHIPFKGLLQAMWDKEVHAASLPTSGSLLFAGMGMNQNSSQSGLSSWFTNPGLCNSMACEPTYCNVFLWEFMDQTGWWWWINCPLNLFPLNGFYKLCCVWLKSKLAKAI